MVSVIVPVYNVEAFLDKCINSIISQTYKDIEIIIINDGSTDDSGIICEKWNQQYDSITYIEQENKGVSVARNLGVSLCKGDWICFVDGDDYLDARSIEILHAEAIKGFDIVLADYSVDNGNEIIPQSFILDREKVFVSENDRIELVKNCFLKTDIADKRSATAIGVPWAKLYRTALIKENGIEFPENLRKMQDAIFNANAFMHADKISYIKNKIYYYSLRNGSVTHIENRDYHDLADIFLAEMKKFISVYDLTCHMESVYNAKEMMLMLDTIKYRFLRGRNRENFTDKIAFVKKTVRNRRFTRQEKKEMRPYLGRAYTVAMVLAELGFYRVLYIMMMFYQKYRDRVNGFRLS